MQNRRNQTFVRGAAVLAIAALFVKIIGVAYRIPLTAMIGTQQMGVYMSAFHVYALAGALTTAGIPVAAAQLCAKRLSAGDERGAKAVFAASRRLLVTLGAVAALLTACFAGTIARLLSCPQAEPAIVAMAASLLLGAWMAAYRARFQGMQRMSAVAVCQVVEQCVRMAAGLFFAHLLLPLGEGMGAAGAMLGMTASQIAGVATVHLLMGRVRGAAYDAQTATRLLHLAMPLTFGMCVMPISSMLESMMLVPRMALAGVSAAQAFSDYGVLTGMVSTVSTLPILLTAALASALMPNIAAQTSVRLLRRRARQGLFVAMLFAAGAGCGLYLVAGQAMRVLYPSAGQAQLQLAQELLQIGAVSAVVHCVAIAAAGILQGMGLVRRSAGIQVLCACVRTIAAFFLLPHFGVAGYAYAGVGGACVSCILALLCVRRRCGAGVLPFGAALTGGVGAALMTGVLNILQPRVGYGTLGLCILVLAGAAVYAAVCVPALLREEKRAWEASRSSDLDRQTKNI